MLGRRSSLMFMVGIQYTRDEIHAELGGSKVSCLPTQGGRIVAACLSRKFSPAARTLFFAARERGLVPSANS